MSYATYFSFGTRPSPSLTYLAESKSLTIPKDTGLTDHQTDAAFTALALHNHSIVIPICTQEEESADGYA